MLTLTLGYSALLRLLTVRSPPQPATTTTATMAGSKQEEVAALEALRDSSAELVRFLDAMDSKLSQMNAQNELSLRVLENWSSVLAISKVAAATTDTSKATRSELVRTSL